MHTFASIVGTLGALAAASRFAETHVPVPRVGLMRKDCVREIPSGTNVEELESTIRLTFPNGTQFEYPHCAPSLDGIPMLGGLPAVSHRSR